MCLGQSLWAASLVVDCGGFRPFSPHLRCLWVALDYCTVNKREIFYSRWVARNRIPLLRKFVGQLLLVIILEGWIRHYDKRNSNPESFED
jgi:hypothetical protein